MWVLLFVLSLAQSDLATRAVPVELKLRLVEVINRDRAAAGLAPVEYSEDLSRAADEHCREMLREGYTSHWNRAGWKPYLRYAQAGIRDATAENLWSLWQTNFPAGEEFVWEKMQEGHWSFMSEQPSYDGHRRAVLGAWHAHVGIGAAYDATGMRLIEVFGTRYAELAPLPARATLDDVLTVRGQILRAGWELAGISLFYEPLPRAMSREELSRTTSYGLPEVERVERPRVSVGWYADGTRGSVETLPMGWFQMPLRNWRGEPGVYTRGVWVRRRGEAAVLGAMTSVIIEARKPRN